MPKVQCGVIPPHSRIRRAFLVGVLTLATILIAWGADRTPAPPAAGHSLSGSALPRPARTRLRVATFNIHSGVGFDGRFDLERTSRSLAGFDLIGLNEVRAGRLGHPDQAEVLGRATEKQWLFAPAEHQWWQDHFGNGVLAGLPVRRWARTPLPGTRGKGYRNVVELEIELAGRGVIVLVTHLDRTQDREAQLARVVQAFLEIPAGPAILMGDLNTTAGDPLLKRLRETPGIVDCLAQKGVAAPGNIDWIFARGLECVAAGISDDGASDHPLAWAELR